MNKFNHMDWDIQPEVEIGNDDFIYGNYFDWDTFRVDEEENLLLSFNVQIPPWSKKITIKEYSDFITQEVFENTSIISDCNLDNLQIVTQGTHLSEIEIQFPNRTDSSSDEIISAIFDYYEVPSGTDYEYALPEDLQYWNSTLENEYEYYKKYPLTFSTYQQTLSDIQTKIHDTSDELTKKALVLSSVIITESLFKSVIVEKIPEETKITPFSKDLLSQEINRILRSSVEDKNKLFKKLFKQNAPKLGWTDLRNSLAHDIESSTFLNDEITYKNNKAIEYKMKLDDLFRQQNIFYEALQEIIDANSTYRF